jgi:insertion element IS1 protein InsB
VQSCDKTISCGGVSEDAAVPPAPSAPVNQTPARGPCYLIFGIACPVGERSRQSAEALWQKIPTVYQEQATFYTDRDAVYPRVIPPAQHRPFSKQVRKTNPFERFNSTLRQRVSRLVRSTLSFSKKLANHIGAIQYFICAYNLTKRAALPG